MIKKEIKYKDLHLDREVKATFKFKEWKDINIEQGMQIFSYFYTLIAIVYSSQTYVEREVAKPELVKDIKLCSVGDFILAFFELPEKEVISTILISTWILSKDDKALVDILCALATKKDMKVSASNLHPVEFNSLIDHFASLMLGARDQLNFTQL